MKVMLKYNEWMPVPYSKGTIENTNTQATIEVNSTMSAGGIVLYPRQRITFDGALYVRSLWDVEGVAANIVEFAESGGGGGGGGGEDEVQVVNAIIPKTGWENSGIEEYPLKITISNDAFQANKLADVVVSANLLNVANECGLAEQCETTDGGLILYAVKTPVSEIPITVNLWGVS